MELVTTQTLDAFLDRYERVRGGFTNEDTESEAMFVMVGQYRGVYVLTTGLGPTWIGLQNATARWTRGGKPYDSVRDAVEMALSHHAHPTSRNMHLYYSEHAIERLRWIADRIAAFKASGDFLLFAE